MAERQGAPAPEALWVSAHVYHQGDPGRLLAHVVDALSDQAPNGVAPDFFFLHYWDGGPHLRLRVRAADPVAVEGLRQLLSDRVGEYLARNPSDDRLDEESYARVASELARREGVHAPALRRPNDSLRFEDYHYDAPRFGAAARPAVELHFVESSRLALTLLRAELSPGHRDYVALSALVLAALVAGGSPDQGEGWRWWGPDDPEGKWAEACRGGYRDQKAAITHTIRTLQAASIGDGPWPSTVERVWWTSATRLRNGLPDDSAAAARVLDVCAHLLCNRLGLTPSREGYLRYLAAQMVTDTPL
ncbi:lantibiotic dehydratase C-terminal domain-containing protein [Streptomyces sp. NPDC088752]|uniref:lantibiotic dehydratase C-terminal domain-containing protein n=1 Tax=Streptomyces sp. NPDC088752 TaxID=3154963 RepID=UPI00342700FF